MNLPAVFERYRGEVEAALRAILADRSLPLYDMLRYHLGWLDEQGQPREGGAGKTLRPTLCLLACQSTGGHYRKALPAAAALELTHNFSLIHDDIQDGDKQRRHRPTVWWLWGQGQALNAGDSMHTLANLALQRLGQHEIPLHKQLRASQLLDRGCLEMIEGQYLDLSYESRLDIGVEPYLDMVSRKTGALMECSLHLGALLGTDDEEVIHCFRRFGRKLGLAFQMRDDFLGIWGEESKMGKPIGNDLRRRKKSLPMVYAFQTDSDQQRAQLREVYQKSAVEEEDLSRVLGILTDLAVPEYVQRMAVQYSQGALAELEGLALSLGPGAMARGSHFSGRTRLLVEQWTAKPK